MNEASNDLSKVFDLDRSQLISRLTANIEQCMRDIEAAREDLRQVVASAKEAQVTPQEVAAMKVIAKLRIKDQRAETAEKLAALDRVGKAVGFDLFDWAERDGALPDELRTEVTAAARVIKAVLDGRAAKGDPA